MIDQTQVQQRVSFTMLTLLVKCLTGGLPIIQLKCFNFLISAPSPRYSCGEPAPVWRQGRNLSFLSSCRKSKIDPY